MHRQTPVVIFDTLVPAHAGENVKCIAVVTQRRISRQYVAYRRHEPYGRHGEKPEKQPYTTSADIYARHDHSGHARGDGRLGEYLGQQRQRGVALAHGDDTFRSLIEGRQHTRESVVYLHIGISAETLGHIAELGSLRFILLFAVILHTAAYDAVIEPHGRRQYRHQRRSRKRLEYREYHNYKQKQQGLARDDRNRTQHPHDEVEADDIDIARQFRRVVAQYELQTAAVIVDIQSARQVAV